MNELLTLFVLHIAAGPAAEQLVVLARQANVTILFSYTDVNRSQSHALEGSYTIDGALRAMLKGKPLEYEFTSPTTITVAVADPKVHLPIVIVATSDPRKGRMLPATQEEFDCRCASQVDPQHAGDWLHWCMVGSQLRWAPRCEREPGVMP